MKTSRIEAPLKLTEPSHRLRFSRLPGLYSVVRLGPEAAIPQWATRGDFLSVTRTLEELSIVCASEQVPADVQQSKPWVCLKLHGPFPFSQTGILLSFIEPLSSNGVPIFAVSTFDTDYVLVPEDSIAKALEVLGNAGHQFRHS